MKQIENISVYAHKFHEAFQKAEGVAEALAFLSEAYKEISDCHPYFNPFKLKLIDTKSIQHTVYYQEPPGISDETIEITNTAYDGHIWKDDDGWCLDDRYWGVDRISQELAKCFLYTNYPENVKELKVLLEGRFWNLCQTLPNFGGKTPEDMNEVLSWDEQYILVGTKLDNIAIMSKADWEELCQRENNWFKE